MVAVTAVARSTRAVRKSGSDSGFASVLTKPPLRSDMAEEELLPIFFEQVKPLLNTRDTLRMLADKENYKAIGRL